MRPHPIVPVFVALTALAPQPAAAQYIARVRFGTSSRVVAVERPGSLSLYDRSTTGAARLRVETPAPDAAVWTDGHLAVPVEGALRVVDLATGATRSAIPWTGAVPSLALDEAGGRLLVLSPDGAVRLHELPSGRALGEPGRARCAALTPSGEVVTADDRAVQRRASPDAVPRVIPLRGAGAAARCDLVRGGSLLVSRAAGVFWAHDAATGRMVLGPTPARGDNVSLLSDALAGGAPVVRLPVSSSQVAATLDLRVGRRVDARYAPPRCVPEPESRCPPASHTYIVDVAPRGNGVQALGVRDVDDELGRDTIFLVDGTGAVRVVAERVPESAYDGLSPDGAWVVRLLRGTSPMLELTPTAGGDARRAPCRDERLAFSPDGRTLVTWRNDTATLWRLDESTLTPVPLR